MTLDHYREIQVEPAVQDEHVLIVSFLCDDLRSPQRLRTIENEMHHLTEETRCTRLVIDFSGVDYAPSTIFGIVIHFVASQREQGVEVRLCCLDEPVRRAFDLLNTGGLVGVFDRKKIAVLTPWPDKGKSVRRKAPPSSPWWCFWE